jgi:hypothetical protein
LASTHTTTPMGMRTGRSIQTTQATTPPRASTRPRASAAGSSRSGTPRCGLRVSRLRAISPQTTSRSPCKCTAKHAGADPRDGLPAPAPFHACGWPASHQLLLCHRHRGQWEPARDAGVELLWAAARGAAGARCSNGRSGQPAALRGRRVGTRVVLAERPKSKATYLEALNATFSFRDCALLAAYNWDPCPAQGGGGYCSNPDMIAAVRQFVSAYP